MHILLVYQQNQKMPAEPACLWVC